MKETLKKHFVNRKGRGISRKLIVIESDDWGSVRIPSDSSARKLILKGLLDANDPFDTLDALETEEDLQSLLEVLSTIKDHLGNSPILTTNMVMANPDFKKIKEVDFREYFYESFLETYQRQPKSSGNFELLQEGINNKLIFPQFHAREHLNIALWMKYLQEGNPDFLTAFDEVCFSIKDTSSNNRRNNIMATYDYYTNEDLDIIKKSIVEGVDLFESIFKIKSETTIAPCYVWDKNIERIFTDLGITTYQGSKFQNIPVMSNSSFKRQLRYMGQKEDGNTYFIRNCLFEPSLNKNIDWVDKCLESIKIAFLWNKPAIIGTHRINFSGGIEPKNRKDNLAMLTLLLSKIIKKWPDAEFISSAELSRIYND